MNAPNSTESRPVCQSDVVSAFPDFYKQFAPHDTYVILGSQGSGTNLLAKILRTVFGFSVVQDRSLIFNAAVAVANAPAPSTIRRQLRHVHRCLFPGWVMKRIRPKNYDKQAKNYAGFADYLDSVPIQTAADFAAFFYTYHAWVNGCRRKAIKSDDIWENLAHIDQVLPARKYILLVRDPRDNALSITNKNFGPRDLYVAAWYVKRRLQAYYAEIARHPDHSLIVKYETLLADPSRFVAEFCERFGIPPAVDAAGRIERLGIRSGNFNKWKHLPPRKLQGCEAVLSDELAAFGYDRPATDGPRFRRREAAVARVHDVFLRIPQKVSVIGRMLVRR